MDDMAMTRQWRSCARFTNRIAGNARRSHPRNQSNRIACNRPANRVATTYSHGAAMPEGCIPVGSHCLENDSGTVSGLTALIGVRRQTIGGRDVPELVGSEWNPSEVRMEPSEAEGSAICLLPGFDME